MASLLMVKTKRRQSSPEASTEHLDYHGHQERKPFSRSFSLWSESRRESIAEADLTNNNHFKTKDQNDNEISKALEILRLQRRQSLANADYHPNTGDNEMMVPKALNILKKMHSDGSSNLSSSAPPSSYNFADYVPGHAGVKRRQTTGQLLDHLDLPGEHGHREMKPIPKALEKLKLERRGSTPALLFRSSEEKGRGDLRAPPPSLNQPRSRRGSITEALLSHAGHLEVRGCKDTKPLPKAIDMLQRPRRGSITEALAYQFAYMNFGGYKDAKPLPKSIQLLRKERRGSIADALLAYSKNHGVAGNHSPGTHTPVSKNVDEMKKPRRQSSPGVLLSHTYYYSDEEGEDIKPVPKMVALVKGSKRQNYTEFENANNFYGVAELDHPMRYSSKLMNSIWGHYNENSVHNFKSLQCAGVASSVLFDAGIRCNKPQKCVPPLPHGRGKFHQRLGELGEAVSLNFIDNLNQYA